MPALDVFTQDAFSLIGLTASIDKAPFKPRLVGSMKIFSDSPQYTKRIFVEEREGKLSILPTAPRGTVNAVRSQPNRRGRDFTIPHVPYFREILADDVLGVRAFGSESELEAVGKYVNDELMAMKDDHEVTHEFHRVNAIKGILLDADNSTVIYNYFTQFNVVQQTVDWFSSDADFAPTVSAVIRAIANALGNEVYGQIVALCGNDYFDAVIRHSSVKTDYERWMNGEMLRTSHLGPEWYTLATNGLMYHNVLFINYRGTIGDVTFIPDDEAYYLPTGVSGMFIDALAPADFVETVNTKGKRYYAKQELLDFGKGVMLHTQSNVLSLCTRPRAVIKSTWAEEEGT